MTIAVNEIIKNPKLISDPKEITYVEDRRKRVLKSIVIPAKYKEDFEEFLKEKAFSEWKKRNEGLGKLDRDKPDFGEVVEELGEWIEF